MYNYLTTSCAECSTHGRLAQCSYFTEERKGHPHHCHHRYCKSHLSQMTKCSGESCGKWYCPTHTDRAYDSWEGHDMVRCAAEGKPFCRYGCGLWFCEPCGKSYCKDHKATKCSDPLCNSRYCADHQSGMLKCTSCDQLYCREHAMKCSSCDNNYCSGHQSELERCLGTKYSGCDKHYCKSHRSMLRKCRQCNNSYCNGHEFELERCHGTKHEECKEYYCKSHLSELKNCNLCSNRYCISHCSELSKCYRCQHLFCPSHNDGWVMASCSSCEHKKRDADKVDVQNKLDAEWKSASDSPKSIEKADKKKVTMEAQSRKKSLSDSPKSIERADKNKVTMEASSRKQSPAETPSWINLNIGGTLFHTYRSTLLKYPDSLLFTLLLDDDVEKDEDGVILLDRNGMYFSYILDWLRDGALLDSLKPEIKEALRHEAVFYGLRDLAVAL